MFEKEINCPILDPVLATSAVDPAKAKVSAFCLVKIGGEISRPIYADTDLPDLDGTIADDEQAIFVFGVKYNATTGLNEFISVMSTPKSKTEKFNASEIPMLDPEYATLGYVLVINESSADFIGGTTLLTAWGITPIYVDNFGFIWY